MPALYQLEHAQLLSDDLKIMAVARSAFNIDELKVRIKDTLNQYLGAEQLNSESLSRFLKRLHYICRLLNGAIAQLVEQWTENPCVLGSNPSSTTYLRKPFCKLQRGFFVAQTSSAAWGLGHQKKRTCERSEEGLSSTVRQSGNTD